MEWESILFKWRKEKGYALYITKLRSYSLGILGFYDAFCLSCIVLSARFWRGDCIVQWLPFYFVILVGGIIIILLNITIWNIPKGQEQLIENFENEKKLIESIK